LYFISKSNPQVITPIKHQKKPTQHFEIETSYVAQNMPAFGTGNLTTQNNPTKDPVNRLAEFQQSCPLLL